jgi:carbon starvation protein
MNGAVLLIVGTICFILAYRIYGRYLSRLFGIDAGKKTPAHELRDDVDYVPAQAPVLFGHHFASIAGAGPIVGPVAAAAFGWGAVAIWVVIGCIFIGAVHDFASMFLSVRGKGRSIGHIIEDQIGYTGRQIFLLFCWAALVLVVAVFAALVAKTFTKTPSVATASLLFIAMAPVFGYLVHKMNVGIKMASCIFVPLLFAFVWIGTKVPCDLTGLEGVDSAMATRIWVYVLLVYVFVASVIPVWLLLQPRDYLNSYLLYAMIILGFVGIVVASPTLEAPTFGGWQVETAKGSLSLFPMLFVMVACGAVSGFHSLVSSGTTAKQLSTEKHILPIGYGGMLVEGFVALMALISVAYLSADQMKEVMAAKGGAIGAFANGLAQFAGKIGVGEAAGETFFAMAISAFLLTTLDTATRLTRIVWQELFLADREDHKHHNIVCKTLSNRFVATLIVIAVSGYLALSGDWKTIWPVFGASNQLLAALTLLVITVVLIRRKVNYWITLIPMLFMMTICIWALWQLFLANAGEGEPNWSIVGSIGFLMVMAVMLVVQAAASLVRIRKKEA